MAGWLVCGVQWWDKPGVDCHRCWVVCSNGSGLEGTVILLVVVISRWPDQEWRGELLGAYCGGCLEFVKPGEGWKTNGWYG